ncbi:MAG: flavohemoglobin expression-modulating QEGLA motif protein [Candidatus Poribacteria bacterium]|nr:flavohemoglobin expression-modulating QEGLA motif protein [Candidatus Poribacteria bacterium]
MVVKKEHFPEKPIETITPRFIQTVCARLANNTQVRRILPDKGRVHIDRQLPFLLVYRRPPNRHDPGTESLVKGQASYLVASGNRRLRPSLSELIRNIVETLSPEFGAFLVLELWAGQDVASDEQADDRVANPGFRIIIPREGGPTRTIETLGKSLRSLRIRKMQSEVEIVSSRKIGPVGLPPLLSAAELRSLGCHLMGLEVRPIYRSATNGQVFPLVRRALVHELTQSLLVTFFQFARTQTTRNPPHYHVMGRRAVVKAVWDVDRRLAEISNAFDFLLQVTPVNSDTAYATFKRKHFESPPVFHYRPQPADPSQLKRKLWNIPIERIEDPTLAQLFREKRDELDKQLTMLLHIESSEFVHGGLQLFGKVDKNLMQLAEELIRRIPPRSREESRRVYLGAKAFSSRVENEFRYYSQTHPQLKATVQIRDDMYSGLMVSRSDLLIGKNLKVPASRVEALIQHEVGTHVLTYFNGRAQPFRLLYSGLAGYEEMQEGIAVLAEYLVGGLSPPRLRTLAARVIAVQRLIEGATFIDTFRHLNEVCRFTQSAAFTISMRIYRGGGFPKDAIYLRGLVRLLDYLKQKRPLEPLFVGKIALEHIPIIRELQLRKVLTPPLLRPRYMDMPNTVENLKQLNRGLSVLDLIKGEEN